MNSKIGILTLRLGENYGGILQNYALQTFLKKAGCEPITFYIEKDIPWRLKLASFLYGCVRRIVFQDKRAVRKWKNEYEKKCIYANTNRFIRENITISQKMSFKQMSLYSNGLDAIIVGSDQVWRFKYLPNIEEYFLKSFISQDIKRIAYAASFGVDHWELPPQKTKECAQLVQLFSAISVREEKAVYLCNNYLGIEATHVVDPTMLISREHYIDLVRRDDISESEGDLFVYILDLSEEKKSIITFIQECLKFTPFTVMPDARFEEVGSKRVSECILPPVTSWLRGFMDAKYVVTDSFHGTVFSIIFNKPFIAVGNAQRGISRFTSLLKMFDLEERLISLTNQLDDKLLRSPIDFDSVNRIMTSERSKASQFLHSALLDIKNK